MSSIRPHPAGGWRAFINKLGVRESRVFQTKALAAAWAATREAEILAVGRGDIPDKTLVDAMRRYASEVAPEHRGSRWEKVRLAAMERTIPCAWKLLSKISPTDIAEWRDARLSVISPSSVSREWSLLTQVITIAIDEWRWLKDSPMRGVRRPAANDERTRRIRPGEVKAICRELGWESREPVTKKQFVALAFLVSLRTGMRSGEILGLSGRDIDLGRRVCRLYKTKNGDDRVVPLSRSATRLLGLVASRDEPFPLTDGSRDALFRKATAAAGVEDLHFHDARAEALTRMSRKVDAMTLAKISGHRDPKILLNRYYRPDMEEVARLL